jgi:hypothetical protein
MVVLTSLWLRSSWTVRTQRALTCVVAVLQEVRGKAVAEGMASDALVEAGLSSCSRDRLLQTALVQVVTADGTRTRVL